MLTIARSPIVASALMTAPAITATPRPRRAVGETTALGLIALTSSNPSAVTCAATFAPQRIIAERDKAVPDALSVEIGQNVVTT